jgi:hypothetical protein
MAVLALYHHSVVTEQLDSYAKHVICNWQLHAFDFSFVNNFSFTQLFSASIER